LFLADLSSAIPQRSSCNSDRTKCGNHLQSSDTIVNSPVGHMQVTYRHTIPRLCGLPVALIVVVQDRIDANPA
jgi:hypothetical protein